MNTNPSVTVSIRSAEIWGPRWKAVEAMIDYWGKSLADAPALPVDSIAEKAKCHPNPKYRK